MGSWGLKSTLPLPTLSFCQIAKQQQQLIQQQHKINLLQQQIQVKAERAGLWESWRLRGGRQGADVAVNGERKRLWMKQNHSGMASSREAHVCFAPSLVFVPMSRAGPRIPSSQLGSEGADRGPWSGCGVQWILLKTALSSRAHPLCPGLTTAG